MASAPTPRGERGTARRVVVPYGRLRRAAAIALGSGAQRSVCGAGAREWAGTGAGITPKEPSTLDNPSVSLRLTAPFAQGSLGDEGCGLPRRFAPRNDSPDPLSFRGGPTGQRGNPSFLRWTMDGGSGRRTWGMASANQISCRNLGRRSGRRPLRKAQSTTQASRRAAKRPRPRPRGMGGNRRKDHPKRGTSAATAQAALSEAESAGRGAGQIRVLPDTPYQLSSPVLNP